MTVVIANSTYYQWYNRTDRLRLRYPSELVVGFLVHNVARGAPVLDLGCGSGRHALLAAELGYDAHGVDLAEDGLRHCREAARRQGLRVTLHRCGMSRTPLAPGSMDAVVCVSALGGNTLEEQRLIVAEARRVLRPGGLLLANFYGAKDATAIAGLCEGRKIAEGTFVLPSYGADPAGGDEVHEFLMHVSNAHEIAGLLSDFGHVRQFETYLPFGNGSMAAEPEPSHLHYAMARKPFG